jgi:hypothetical protein
MYCITAHAQFADQASETLSEQVACGAANPFAFNHNVCITQRRRKELKAQPPQRKLFPRRIACKAFQQTSTEQNSKEWEKVQSLSASVLPQARANISEKVEALAQEIKRAKDQGHHTGMSRCGAVMGSTYAQCQASVLAVHNINGSLNEPLCTQRIVSKLSTASNPFFERDHLDVDVDNQYIAMFASWPLTTPVPWD